MAVLKEVTDEVTSETRPLSGMVGGVSRGAVGRRRKKKPASILDEVTEEVSKEPVPEGALAQVMRETETDPERVRQMRTEGQRLTTDQQRIAFEAERARPLTDVALGAAGAFIQAAPQTAGQLLRGTAKFAYEGVGKPLGEAVLSGLIYEPGSDEQEQAVRRAFGGANSAVRSLASGVAQDIEETANAAIRAGYFGTSITDRAAEKLGLVTPEQSFNNYLAREDMRRGEAEDIQENPDRAATMLARNPLAGTVIEGAAMLSGQGALTPEAKRAALAGYEESLLQEAKFRPDEDISMLGEVLSPVGLPARLVKPVTSALGGTMEAAGGLAVRGVTKPTIRGVNPLEGVGIGIRRVGEGAEKLGAGVSQAITGRPDTFLAAPGTIVSAFTKRPGQLVEGVGRTLRDVGRQIDEGGIRGRTGIVERLGRDPQSADWIRDLFGPGAQKRLEKMERKNKQRVAEGKEPIRPGRGGVMRARTADYGLRLANSLTKSGVSGAALNGIIGAADIETAEEFGRSTGVGFGIGSYMAGRVPERIGAALDPTTGLATKIDRVTEIDPLDRRLDEDADLKRFRATADPELVRQVEKLSSPEEQVASRMRELDDLFQRKAEADYAEEDTTELDAIITQKADELSALQESTKNLTQEDRDERRRAVELIMADGLDLLKSNGRAAGLNGVNVKILDPSQIESFIRERWGQNLEQAEAIVTQLGGRTDLSPSEEQSLLRANQAVQKFQEQVQLWPQQTGFALSDSDQADAPAHLRMANIGAPTIVMNTEQLMRDPRRVGLRYLLQHESNHILEQFREVQEMQRPVRDLWFGKRIVRPDGTVLEATPGIITDDWINDVGIPMYAERLYGPGGETKFRDSFASPQQAVEYVRSELMSELSALSETGYSTIREALDSPGQAVVDRLLISRKNSMLGRLRQALEAMGVELDSKGDVKSVIFGDQAPFDPDALAIMRQYKRNLREFNDMLTYAGGTAESDVEISVTELMTNRALQEAYKDDVIWDKETVLDIRDDEGNAVSQIVIPDDPTLNSATGEYRIVGGQLVDENGNVLPPLDPNINLTAFPDGSRASIDSRIARNPDGSPKILQNKEIQARARQRDQMIKDAIDNAPDDGFEGRLRDTGNGSYRGVMSPSQLEAVMALPNSVIPPSLKKNIAAFNEVLQGRDGTRILMEYQAALRGGKYRALSPRIRDVVPIGYQFSKQGNFLATTISVSRMFDKMNLWSQKRPENLNLWGRDLGKFWEDVTRVLDNHNRGLTGQTGLDVDPDIAMQKKNRINDFFNLFTKETESLNPSRTTLPARRGKDSADRLIMSARMDRINQMQISNAQKLPVDYGKMLVNFFPENEAQSLRLDQFQDAPVENDIVGGAMPRFLPGIRYTSLPDDPKKTMADFYMLNAMITTPPTGWSMGKFGGEATMYAPSADPTGRYAGVRAEKYQDALDEAKQTLIPSLHSKIQKALHFAIAAELRHAIPRRQPADLAETEFYQEYMRQYAIQGAGMPDLKKEKGPRRYKGESEGYKASFVAMENARKKLGMSIADVARFAEQLYRRGDWSSSYGGNPWGDIAAHLAQMSDPTYSTERVRAVATDPETGRMQIIETNEFRDPGAYNAMFQEIDRAYDLQHNTNTVFNKLKKYYLGVEGYGWIAKMLDFKANVANPRELRGFVSGTMGKLADAWFADMRADAPLTQDLEAKVIEQLPPTLVENMDPSQFTDLLKDLVSDYYRKSSSGVRREAPFENIANAAEGIFRNKGGKSDDWKAIKKDQNAHIGLILDDHFGDLGVARTDATKLFRMLLVEGRDPRVTGKKPSPADVPNVEIKLPKPKPMADQNWFMGSTFKPKTNVSTPTNLNKFVETLMTAGFNGLKLGDVTVLNAGGSGKVATLKVYAGDSVSEGNLLTTAQIPGGKKRDAVDWLSDYAMMRAKQAGYGNVMDWMQQNLNVEMKPQMPAQSEGISNLLENLPWAARNRVNQLLENLQDQEWVDANLAVLPPSDIDASSEFVESLLLGNSEGLAKAKIIDALSPNDVEALGKYLYDVGKWASDKLEARKEAQMKEDDADVEEQGLTPDSPAVGYAKADDTLMTVAEAAEMIGPFDPEEIGGTNHVYFTDNSGTAITNPYEDLTGDPLAAQWAPGNKSAIMKYWADNGVLPSVSETALAIFDLANPGHPYSKEGQIMPADKSVAMAENEVAAQKQAMEFLENMLLEDPIKIGDNTWELEGVEDDDGNTVGGIVKLNGVAVSNTIPFDPEIVAPTVGNKAIYDDFFALDWMKDWKAPTESGSLLSPEQDQMMVAASELVAALSGGYIAQPEVTVGGKTFWAKINEQGNMVLFGTGEGGYLTGAYPIQGSKTMDPIDLEAAVYEGLSVLGAKVDAKPEAPKITTQMINEAAEALMNDETTSLGKYTFEPIASGLGGTRVNIYVEPGMEDSVGYFMLDPGEYREPSDMLDAFYDKISEFLENNPPDEGGGKGPGARFMPGITPTTLYNFYHIATLESQGRIKSDYGRELAREYLTAYRQKYLDTIGPLVADQIKKYIGRGRVDEGVTDDVLEAAANDPAALDELMRQTYRSDMKRRNDVWNNITEHLRGLAAAGTPRDIIFRIDRLNNAIHNTNELLFSKFKNAGELMDAFEAINDARDERAYGRMVDKDLRDIEEFEGGPGPGARFMPASKASIVDRIVKNAKIENRLKGESAWLSPKGWVNVDDHLDIFPEDLAELRRVNYDDLKDRGLVRVRQMGKTLWYEGNPTRKMLKELKDTAVEKRLKLEEDPGETYRNTARFMPAAIEGTFYHGTKRKDPFNKRRGRRPIYGSEGVEVTFLSPSYILATDFGPNVFQGILKDENIFDPTDPKDLKKVYKTADESELFQDVLEDGPDAMIKKIKQAGKNVDQGWEDIEIYADVIKAAGFNGFVAYEGQIPAVGVFPDRIDVTKFSQMGFVRNSMDLPQGGVGSLGKGTIYPDVYPRTQAEMLTDLNPPEPEPFNKFDIPDDKPEPLKIPIQIKNTRAKRSDLERIFPPDPRDHSTSMTTLGNEKMGDVQLHAWISGNKKILQVYIEGDFAGYSIKLPGEIVTDGSDLPSLVRQVNKIIEPFRKPTTGNAMVYGILGGLLTREGGPPVDFAKMQDPEMKPADFEKIQKPGARFMPGSSQDDQSLAGVAAPVSDQAPLSGARFMPGYNPRYTDDDGNFDFGLYSEDKRKTIAYLRDRMGITRKDFPNDEEWKRTIRETMRDVIRGG
jgi:hypothetical protein